MAHSLQSHQPHQPTKAEIIDLAALEGHDADIPSNLGSVRNVPSSPSTRPSSPTNEKDVKTAALEKDVEKATTHASSSIGADADEEQDPNIVDFDGPDDPQNPLNWGFTKKWGMVMLISAITFLTPLASSMFAPGVPEVMRDFGSTNDMLEGFMVSVYVLGFSFGPLGMFKAGSLKECGLTYQSSRLCQRCLVDCLCIIRAICCSLSLPLQLRFPPIWACS